MPHTSATAGAPATSRKRRDVAARGDGARLRTEIVQAAMELVDQLDDPRQLSLRAVARHVGIAATSIYLHFDSLEALLLETKANLWAQFGERMIAAAASAEPTAYARVVAFGQAYLAFANDRPGTFRALFTTSWDFTTLRDNDYVGQSQFELLVEAVREVSVDDDDAMMRAVQLWTGLHGIVTLRTPMSRFPWPSVPAMLDTIARRWTTP